MRSNRNVDCFVYSKKHWKEDHRWISRHPARLCCADYKTDVANCTICSMGDLEAHYSPHSSIRFTLETGVCPYRRHVNVATMFGCLLGKIPIDDAGVCPTFCQSVPLMWTLFKHVRSLFSASLCRQLGSRWVEHIITMPNLVSHMKWHISRGTNLEQSAQGKMANSWWNSLLEMSPRAR